MLCHGCTFCLDRALQVVPEVETIPSTLPLYMSDSELLEITATCTAKTDEGLIFDRTIFHPQGGGQPCDVGEIFHQNKSFPVTRLIGREGSPMVHVTDAGVEIGEAVVMKVDGPTRLLHSRLHSAGHLLDVAMDRVGPPALTPTKGYHFASGPYVEYVADEWQDTDLEALRTSLEKELNLLIGQATPVMVKSVNSLAELSALCRAPGYAVEAYKADPAKQFRVVKMNGDTAHSGCPCGGTHVKNVSQIGKVEIRKVKLSRVKGVQTLRVAYKLV